MLSKTLALAGIAATAYAQGNSTGTLVEALSANPDLSNLTTYLGALSPEFVSTLGSLQNVTLLAPNNDAFSTFLNSSAGSALASSGNNSALIEAILSYHVLNGTYESFGENASFVPTALQPPTYANVTGGQRVHVVPGSDGSTAFFSGLLANSSTVGNATNFTGGVIHVIDAFLVVPQNVSATAIEANLTAAVGALTKADLASAVDGLQDVTIFVPDNEAFRSIGNLVGNLTMENLTSILTYHVINGTVGYSTDLMNMTLPTLNGENITISIIGENVFVNSAKVTVPNVLVANGVVHVIDGVLNPANATAAPNSSEETSTPAFEGAQDQDTPELTSGVPTPTGTTNPTSQASAAATSSSSGVAMPMFTGALGPAALFGGAALLANL